MQYFQQASETENTNNAILCTLTSEDIAADSGTYFCRLTNDLSKVFKEFSPISVTKGERYDVFQFQLVYSADDEDLNNGLVHFEPTGSYTWYIGSTSSGTGIRIIDRGKAVLYPHGEYKTATKFGNEVTYTEHLNPTTNTIYVNI